MALVGSKSELAQLDLGRGIEREKKDPVFVFIPVSTKE